MQPGFLPAGNLAGTFIKAACIFSLLVFTLSMLGNVLLRLFLDLGLVWLQDLQSYSFFILVVTAVPVAYLAERHVRIDGNSRVVPWAFGRRSSDFLALVSGGLICALSARDTFFSWAVLEGSLEPGGLAGFFVVKTFLPASFGVLLLVAMARLLGRAPRQKM